MAVTLNLMHTTELAAHTLCSLSRTYYLDLFLSLIFSGLAFA